MDYLRGLLRKHTDRRARSSRAGSGTVLGEGSQGCVRSLNSILHCGNTRRRKVKWNPHLSTVFFNFSPVSGPVCPASFSIFSISFQS